MVIAEKKEILVIDIETTGFQGQGGAIVEVGIVALDLGTGFTATIFDSVCKEDHISERHRKDPMGWIFKNSTLTVEMVRHAPVLRDIQEEIQHIIDLFPLGATAYNRDFDFNFLESRGFSFSVKLPCPMKLATQLCKLPSRHPGHGRYKWPSVEEAWEYFFPGVGYIEQHRGADDALHEAKIVYELYRRGLFEVL